MKNFLRLCEIHQISPKGLFELVERRGGIRLTDRSVTMVNEPFPGQEKEFNQHNLSGSDQNPTRS